MPFKDKTKEMGRERYFCSRGDYRPQLARASLAFDVADRRVMESGEGGFQRDFRGRAGLVVIGGVGLWRIPLRPVFLSKNGKNDILAGEEVRE